MSYSWCFVGCCFQDLFQIFFYTLSHHPYGRIDMTAAWKKLRFILSDMSDFHMIDNLLTTVHAFAIHTLTSFSVHMTLPPMYVNLSTSFRELSFSVPMSPLWAKHMYSILSTFTWRPMPPAACSRLCRRDSVWVGVFAIASGPGDRGSIPGRVISKAQKMVLDAASLSTQQYKVRIKVKVGSIQGIE